MAEILSQKEVSAILHSNFNKLRTTNYELRTTYPRVGAVKPGFFINFGPSACSPFRTRFSARTPGCAAAGRTKPVMSLQTSNYL